MAGSNKPRKSRQKKNANKKKQAAKRKGWRTAATSDIHELYELSVQEPEAEVDLIDQVWKEQRGRLAKSIREDFCGTAIASIEWVKRRPSNTAIGVDIDPEVLEWGRSRQNDRITPKQAARITLVEGDVLKAKTEPVETLLAMNFSYYLFKTRKEMIRYFKVAYSNITDDGLFLLDAYGGSDSFLEMEEDRNLDGFTYIWDQSIYNPINGEVVNHIHFRFPDGTKLNKAFTYEWRLWTLPEIQEMLLEAGFKEVHVYWEGTDEETEEGNGEWAISTRGEACEGWIAYLVAIK